MISFIFIIVIIIIIIIIIVIIVIIIIIIVTINSFALLIIIVWSLLGFSFSLGRLTWDSFFTQPTLVTAAQVTSARATFTSPKAPS